MGYELVARAFQQQGVDTFFFIMGAPMSSAEKAAIDLGIRGIDVRHEQAAAMMAHAYGRIRNRPGVCMACSGPGTLNFGTGLATALMDCVPVVALGGASPIGEEMAAMLQAMKHRGPDSTGYALYGAPHEDWLMRIKLADANTPRDSISRLEQMIGMAGLPMTVSSIRGQIASAIKVIVQLSRLSDGKRRVMSIAEITGLEGDIIQMQEVYKFIRTGTAPDGAVQGHFQATGVRPRFLTDLVAMGI